MLGQLLQVHGTVRTADSQCCSQGWLHPVRIYGCFALLGLISAVHSQIT